MSYNKIEHHTGKSNRANGANDGETGLSLLVQGDGLVVLDEDSAIASVAAITKYHKQCLLKQEKAILCHCGGQKSKIEVLAGPHLLQRFSERSRSFCGPSFGSCRHSYLMAPSRLTLPPPSRGFLPCVSSPLLLLQKNLSLDLGLYADNAI